LQKKIYHLQTQTAYSQMSNQNGPMSVEEMGALENNQQKINKIRKVSG
jgi:hypothetical protein